MAVTQGIQRLHFALETRLQNQPPNAAQRARAVVAVIASKRDLDDPVAATREVLDALGLLDGHSAETNRTRN